MAENQIVAEMRTEFGKGAARRIRRAHKIPAVLYGHGSDPVHLSLPGHATMLAVKTANAVLTLDVEGEERLALVKDVQRDPVRPVIEHVDLVIVRRGEKVIVDVPVSTTGEAGPETFVTVENQTIQVAAEAMNIPDVLEIDIAGAAAGTQVLAGAVVLPTGVSLVSDPELLVVNITQAQSAEALEAELAEAEAGAGIEQEPSAAEKADAEGTGEAGAPEPGSDG